MIELLTATPEETFNLGLKLGALLEDGDFLALEGDLGAGKTHLVKGIAIGLDLEAGVPITSPTYAIVNIHKARTFLYHFDLYRLARESEIEEIGFDEYISGNGVCIVEWADRLGSLLPVDNLHVKISILGDQDRLLSFSPSGSRATELMRLLEERKF